jgi:hypothetical protein
LLKLKSIVLGAAALAAVVAPVGASALSANRASAPVLEANEAEGSTGIIIGVVAAAAIIGGIIIIADDDEPNSP